MAGDIFVNRIQTSSALENISIDASGGTEVSEGGALAATPAAFAAGVAGAGAVAGAAAGGAAIGDAVD